MSSVLQSIQQEIVDRLTADPFFVSVPILAEQPRDVAYELQASAAAAGTWGVVLVPQAQVKSPNAPGPIFDPVEFAIRFRENAPVSSATGALECAETALAILHLYRPPSVNEVLVAAPQVLQRVTEANVVAYEVQVRTQVCVSYEIPQVAAPGISISADLVTLSCATPGAAIFYTVDGSVPVPRGATASLYNSPITVNAACTIRGRAWLAGYLASVEAREVLE